MKLGWFLDQTNDNVVKTFKSESINYDSDPDKTLDAVLKQRQIFYLTLITHQFNIMEDGSIEISMDYIASAESETNNPISANILRLDYGQDKQIKELNERLKMVDKRLAEVKLNDLEKADKGILDKIETSVFGNLLRDEKEIKEEKIFNDLVLENEELDKEREDIIKQLESLPREYRIKRFKSITEKLLNCGLIRVICKTKEDMEKFINLRYTSVQTVADIRDIVKTIEAITKANSQVVSQETVNNSWDELSKNNEENNDEEVNSGQAKTLSQKEGKLCPDINGKQINFFYLRRLDGCYFR